MKKIVFLTGLFLLLSLFVSFQPHSSLDLQITKNIQRIKSPIFSEVMHFVSAIGFSPYIEIIIFVSSLFLYFLGLRLEAIFILFSTAGSALLGSLIKIIFGRPRPDALLVQVFSVLNDKSFPSNHVLVYTVLFGFLLYISLYVLKNYFLRLVLFVTSLFFILSVGISRIYLGAHWASDVLAGYLLGFIFLACSLRLYRIIESNAKR